MRPAAPFVLWLAACATTPAGTDPDSGGGGYHETGVLDDTGDSGDTADTADTGDSGDTADTGDTGPATLVRLDAWPAHVVVNVGATWPIRVVGTDSAGDRAVYAGATFAPADSAVLSVDSAGLVTALAEGVTTVTVAAEGHDVELDVEVRAPLQAHVKVVEGATGAPIEGATVATAAGGEVLTDAAGEATLVVADGGPTTFTAWIDDDHYAISVVDTVSRELVLPLQGSRHNGPSGMLHGAVDFSGMADAEMGEEVFGLASASVQTGLALFAVEDLLAPERELDYHGVKTDVPSNLFVEGYLEDYYALAWSGPVAAWGLGGPVAIGDLAAGLNGTGDAMALIIDHLDDMTWGVNPGETATSGGETDAPLAPAISFNYSQHVSLPDLSDGFDGSEQQLVCTFEETADGWVLTGLGLGAGDMDVDTVPTGSVPGSTGGAVYTLAQVGGLGSARGLAVSVGEYSGGVARFPPLQDIPVITTWTPGERALDFTVDPSATLVRVVFEDERSRIHELWTDGSWSGTVDKQNPAFQRGLADVTVQSYAVLDGSFEDWAYRGAWAASDHDPTTRAEDTLRL